ncbi:MAG: YggT family protein [Psittacicella sp.]
MFYINIIAGLIDTYCFLLILRIWFQLNRVSIGNPLSISLREITNWILNPINKVVPNYKTLNIGAIILTIVLLYLRIMMITKAQLSIEFYIIVALLSFIKIVGTLLFWLLIITAIGSWFLQGNQLYRIIIDITNPILDKVRSILPKTGMLDFSVIVMELILIIGNHILYHALPVYWAIA